MDFIFMLTRGDKTIEDSLTVLNQIAAIGLRHVGFKDVGVARETLVALTAAIRDIGATSYMEVVSESPEACLNSARTARDLGVDRLLGGTQVKEIKTILAGTRTQYFPFPGRPAGHPTKLAGSASDVEADCRRFMDMGCAGADLLAYRATEAEPLALVEAARRGLGPGYLIVAGSITTPERIRAIANAGADAFTIGTAVFDGSYSPRKGSLLSQLSDVLTDIQAA
jgi:hypothetical protein